MRPSLIHQRTTCLQFRARQQQHQPGPCRDMTLKVARTNVKVSLLALRLLFLSVCNTYTNNRIFHQPNSQSASQSAVRQQAADQYNLCFAPFAATYLHILRYSKPLKWYTHTHTYIHTGYIYINVWLPQRILLPGHAYLIRIFKRALCAANE